MSHPFPVFLDFLMRWTSIPLTLTLAISIVNGWGEIPVAPDAAGRAVAGAAAIEQGRGQEAVGIFDQLIRSDPKASHLWVNLALGHQEMHAYEEAIRALQEAERLDPDLPHVAYNLAICQKHLGQPHLAVSLFRRVLAADPRCAEAHYNLGVLLRDLGQWDQARTEFERAVELAPDHLYAHYHLMRIALLRSDNPTALREFRLFSRLRARSPRFSLDPFIAEKSQYSVPLLPESRDGWDVSDVPASFGFDAAAAIGPEARVEMPLSRAGVTSWCEADADERPDIVVGFRKPSAIFLNLAEAGLQPRPLTRPGPADMSYLFPADYDNDGDMDLLAIHRQAVSLLRNRGSLEYETIPVNVRLPAEAFPPACAAAVDYDHDGDIDLMVSWERGSSATLLRNNGDGTFADASGTLASCGGPGTFAWGDFDGDMDTDMVFAPSEGPPALFRNLGAGRFERALLSPALSDVQGTLQVLSGDIDNDLALDVLLVDRSGRIRVLLNSGDGTFRDGPRVPAGLPAASSLATGDFDNDGFLDVVMATRPDQAAPALVLLRGTPQGLVPLPDTVFTSPLPAGSVHLALPEDADADGDLDLLILRSTGELALQKNRGVPANHWIRFRLVGRRTNRDGVGVRVDLRDEWRRQRRQGDGMAVHFGLGPRSQVQVARLVWPSGLVQNEISPRGGQSIEITEDARIPASCPFLFAWDGQKFQFITDFLGGGALGEFSPPGEEFSPDSDDVLNITRTQLVPREGIYTLRVAFELQEVIFIDAIELHALRHEDGVTPHADEGLYQPPSQGIQIHGLRNLRPVSRAWDTRGQDVTERLRDADQRAVCDFERERQPGLATRHALTLDLGTEVQPEQSVLILDGWTEWTNSSSVLARSQRDVPGMLWPSLEVQDADGNWQPAPFQVGVPVGKGRPVFIDLRKAWRSESRKVRITTDFAVFWDEARVAETTDANVDRVALPMSRAELLWRGYSTPYLNEDGNLELYRYLPTLGFWPWRYHRGTYTAYGPVSDLISSADSRLLIAAPGDELQVDFRLPAGVSEAEVRGFVFRAVGWGKDADPNTATRVTVSPLPHHAMGRYPPAASRPDPEPSVPGSRPVERRRIETTLPRQSSLP